MTRHRRHGGGRRADPDKQACDRWLMETIIKAPYIRPPDHPLGSNLAEVRAYYHAAREAAPEGVKSMWATTMAGSLPRPLSESLNQS